MLGSGFPGQMTSTWEERLREASLPQKPLWADADHNDDAADLIASELHGDRGVQTSVSTLELSGRSKAGFPSRLLTHRRCFGGISQTEVLCRTGKICIA